jgi:hypothetical protein
MFLNVSHAWQATSLTRASETFVFYVLTFFLNVSSCVADDELDARLRDMATKVPIYACELDARLFVSETFFFCGAPFFLKRASDICYKGAYICMHLCMCVCIVVVVYLSIYLYIYIYIYIYTTTTTTHMYILYMHVCMYI